jgi:hypothetical protein
MMVSKAHGLRVYGDGDLFIYCIFPWYPAGITAKRMKAPSPRYLTSQLWMNFILIELNMTCKGSTQFTPEFFCFDVHIFCCAIIYLFSWKIIPFWVLMFASISPCASNTCYIYAYIFYLIFFFRYSWIDLCFLLSCFVFWSHDLPSNSKHCRWSLLYDVIMNSPNSTPKPLQDCFYKDVVFRQWYEEVSV